MTIIEEPYVYGARLSRVVDGDTLYFDIDLGFRTWRKGTKVRLDGIDTHEIHIVPHDSEEYRKGMNEMEFVEDWLKNGISKYTGDDGKPFVIRTIKDKQGKFGRYLGVIYRKCDGRNLNDDLLDEYEVEY